MAATGADILLDVLRTEGVRTIFGNPGTTELPLMDALADAPDLDYVLGLQEAAVVGMADGFAQATGRPAFVNLHAGPGLGNGMGALFNARANRSPLVVSVGQQDSRSLISDPLLSCDFAAMSEQVTKWSREVRSGDELAPLLRRAFADSQSPPVSPVLLSLPGDVLESDVLTPTPPTSLVRRDVTPGAIAELAELLVQIQPGRLAIVAGDEVAHAGAEGILQALAEKLGAVVFASPLNGRFIISSTHPLAGAPLSFTAAGVRSVLAGYERILLVGAQGFMFAKYTGVSPIPDGADLVHLSPEVEQIGRMIPVRLGVVGSLNFSLDALLKQVAAKVDESAARQLIADLAARREDAVRELDRRAHGRHGASPPHPMAAVERLFAALPRDVVLVQEAITTSRYLPGFHRTRRPGTYFANRGGGLGWAMPAAVGVSLGYGRERVVCLVGDGSSLYSPQALWTAAHRRLPVLFVVPNNREYLVLREQLAAGATRSTATGRFVGTQLDDPPIDFPALAHSFGVPGSRVASALEIGDAVRAALEVEGPYLLEIPVASPGR